jgi:hypothetical protein
MKLVHDGLTKLKSSFLRLEHKKLEFLTRFNSHYISKGKDFAKSIDKPKNSKLVDSSSQSCLEGQFSSSSKPTYNTKASTIQALQCCFCNASATDKQ